MFHFPYYRFDESGSIWPCEPRWRFQRLSTTIHRSFDYGYMYPDQRLRRPIEHVLETLPDEGLVVTLRRISVGFMKGFLG